MTSAINLFDFLEEPLGPSSRNRENTLWFKSSRTIFKKQGKRPLIRIFENHPQETKKTLFGSNFQETSLKEKQTGKTLIGTNLGVKHHPRAWKTKFVLASLTSRWILSMEELSL
jgi:hypothetical protein